MRKRTAAPGGTAARERRATSEYTPARKDSMTASVQLLPPRAFLVPLLTRALIIWASLRTMTGLGIALLGSGAPFHLGATTAALLTLVSGTLCWIEIRRQREHFLLGNLGVSQPVLFLLGLAPAAAIEILLQAAWHVRT
jgi:hypothetical protein